MAMIESWGQELVIDFTGANNKVCDKDAILEFGIQLIKAIDMEAWGEPQIEYFGKDNKKGWTYSQLITTSNICFHFCDDGAGYGNIFSCKPIDAIVVRNLVQSYFEPNKTKQKFFLRGDW